jgi:hypothetical protein
MNGEVVLQMPDPVGSPVLPGQPRGLTTEESVDWYAVVMRRNKH